MVIVNKSLCTMYISYVYFRVLLDYVLHGFFYFACIHSRLWIFKAPDNILCKPLNNSHPNIASALIQ